MTPARARGVAAGEGAELVDVLAWGLLAGTDAGVFALFASPATARPLGAIGAAPLETMEAPSLAMMEAPTLALDAMGIHGAGGSTGIVHAGRMRTSAGIARCPI